MRRRDVVALLASAAAAWPLAARSQQSAQVRRVGMLIGYEEKDPETQARVATFRQTLEQLGWKEGRNIRIDYRFAPASPDEAQLFAKELVAFHPDVLVGNSTPAAAALCERRARFRSYS
jgi:putative ABC transport system substrate-binding protein